MRAAIPLSLLPPKGGKGESEGDSCRAHGALLLHFYKCRSR